MMRWLTAWTLLLCAMVGGFSCSGPKCTGETSDSDDAPLITRMELLPQDPDDPWTLLFAVTFLDATGDLGGGQAEIYLNGDLSETFLLQDSFLQSDLPLSAVEGVFWFPLRFEPDLRDGAEIDLGLQVLDEKRQRSNCYSMTLTFEVTPVAMLRAPCHIAVSTPPETSSRVRHHG